MCRKLAVHALTQGETTLVQESYDADTLQRYLGTPLYTDGQDYNLEQPIGKVLGLSVSGYSGNVLEIEAVSIPRMPGKEYFEVTGNLKQVMSESVRNSRLCAAVFAAHIGSSEYFRHSRIAVNFVGAEQKDGPSAGAAITIALLSLALGQPVSPNLAITGTIDLNLRIGKVGGIREKVTAAKVREISRVCLPFSNKPDWEDLPETVRDGMTPVFAKTLKEVFDVAFKQKTESKPATIPSDIPVSELDQ